MAMASTTATSSSIYPTAAPGESIEDYCNEVRRLKIWKLDGYDGKDDICNPYNYIPSRSLGIVFLALFAFVTVFHLLQTVFPSLPAIHRPWPSFLIRDAQPQQPIPWRRRWPFILTVTSGGILEIVGWGPGRLAGVDSPDGKGPFTTQIVTLIIAPTFFSAAIYTLFGWYVSAIENPTNLPPSETKRYSLLKARAYVIVFVTSDIVSLVIQAIGGGIASTANDNDKSQQNLGTHIMEAGIVFQLVATIIFLALFFHFRRSISLAARQGVTVGSHNPSSGLAEKGGRNGVLIKLPEGMTPLWWAHVGVGLETCCIIFRGIYRTIELAQGWSGFLISHEDFIFLDAIPMVLCMVFFVLFHSNWTLPPLTESYNETADASDLGALPVATRQLGSGATLNEGYREQDARAGTKVADA